MTTTKSENKEVDIEKKNELHLEVSNLHSLELQSSLLLHLVAAPMAKGQDGCVLGEGMDG